MKIEEARRVRWHMDMAFLMGLASFRPRTFCECGVGPLDIAAAPDVYASGLWGRILLVEPNPALADLAQAAMPRATIIRAAIGEPGRAALVVNGGSSYLAQTWSPTPLTHTAPEVDVEVMDFAQIDDGEIDAMVLDCEGQEWAVLSRMRSLPRFLSVEVWKGHPKEAEMFAWLNERCYRVRITTGPQGETMLFDRG